MTRRIRAWGVTTIGAVWIVASGCSGTGAALDEGTREPADTGGNGGDGLAGSGSSAAGGLGNSGGTASGGASPGGGATGEGGGASGGAEGTGGAGTGGSGSGSELADRYPCDGSTEGYAVVATKAGSTWTVTRSGTTLHSGTDFKAAVEAGLAGLTSGRTSKEALLVQGDGSIPASTRISLPSHTVLNVCGTIDVTGSGAGDMAPIYARDRTQIDIPHVTIAGTSVYAMFFRDVSDLHLGHIEVLGSNGIGLRIDNHPSAAGANPKVANVRLDRGFFENTGSHGVETYGVDGFEVGTVVARNTGECGVLLNNTINADIGLIDAEGAATGTGYAAFRLANRAGRLEGGSYATNIRVGELRAEGGGRGFFCVSESGGAEIAKVEILAAGTDPAIFVEDCYNVRLATESGTVDRGASSSQHRVRIAARTTGGADGGPQFLGYSDGIVLENMRIEDSPISESPCGGNNSVRNNTLSGSSLSVCAGTNDGGNVNE